jgi:hypothetical protein
MKIIASLHCNGLCMICRHLEHELIWDLEHLLASKVGVR